MWSSATPACASTTSRWQAKLLGLVYSGKVQPRSLPSPGSAITALLGPTNTGKTHRCVSRMLEYDTGMLGLPLRLLAREVYDRVTREAGAEHVALVTGEERIMPFRPRYWICTTEAMPTNLEVDFVGVDEIQLAAHPTRGHLFTDRLLYARGRFETWFLGAATMRRVIEELVPSARFQSAQRLSKLSFTGALNLGQVPGRSAVVAFSVSQVYELAERLRVRKGGVAVVLGALSPKTRNAQVNMYQAGEVDHVVATDAIGMGLNMSIAHVALAALHKFDGRTQRTLSAAELAQIAGRAGRSIHDGTFGTLEPAWLDPRIVHDIEHHAFPQVRQIMWRNRDLDFSSVDALLDSLQRAPSQPRLRLVNMPADTAAFVNLAQRTDVRAMIRDEEHVRLLWNVCQIPDYRQLLPDLHAELLFTILEHLVKTGGQLDDEWLSERLVRLSETSGDIDTLVGRITSVRTWTYVCQRHQWVRNAALWQDRTRALEDELSDALHERLISRFVSRRRAAVVPAALDQPRKSPRSSSANHQIMVTSDGDHDPHHPFAALRGLRATTKPNVGSSEGDAEAPKEWGFAEDGTITVNGVPMAKLTAGPTLRLPGVQLLTEVSGKARSKLGEDAQRSARRYVEELAHAEAPSEVSNELRGVVYQINASLGAVRIEDIKELLATMPGGERERLAQLGIHVGRVSAYLRSALKPKQIRLRLPVVRAFFGETYLPDTRFLGDVTIHHRTPISERVQRIALQLGYVTTADAWVRCDVAERLIDATLNAAATPTTWASLLGCRKRVAIHIARELSAGAGLTAPIDVVSRDASRDGETPKKRFRRRRHLSRVKQVVAATVSPQK